MTYKDNGMGFKASTLLQNTENTITQIHNQQINSLTSSGRGLKICTKIIHKLNGTFDIVSFSDKSVFTIKIPNLAKPVP